MILGAPYDKKIEFRTVRQREVAYSEIELGGIATSYEGRGFHPGQQLRLTLALGAA